MQKIDPIVEKEINDLWPPGPDHAARANTVPSQARAGTAEAQQPKQKDDWGTAPKIVPPVEPKAAPSAEPPGIRLDQQPAHREIFQRNRLEARVGNTEDGTSRTSEVPPKVAFHFRAERNLNVRNTHRIANPIDELPYMIARRMLGSVAQRYTKANYVTLAYYGSAVKDAKGNPPERDPVNDPMRHHGML